MKEEMQELTQLLEETGKAHHQAFLETDGYDPEWPIWYADYLIARLPSYIEAHITKSELIYLMVHLNKSQSEEAPEESWASFYARYMNEHYSYEAEGVNSDPN
jgi:hypothetical protein